MTQTCITDQYCNNIDTGHAICVIKMFGAQGHFNKSFSPKSNHEFEGKPICGLLKDKLL